MNASLDSKSIFYRKQILEILNKTQRGHIGPALSIVEIIRVLYDHILNYDPQRPKWLDRDRFILSKGHGCLGLYVVLAEKGFFPEEELWQVSEDGAILGGHPEYTLTPGVEASTGSLGHGLSIGIGMALAAKMDKKDYRTFVLLGDGECNEGSIWEAALSASKHQLSNLIVMVDSNKMQCYSKTADVLDLEPFVDKWESFGFAIREVDGHDIRSLKDTFLQVPFDLKKPNLIFCHTIKGKGVPGIENNPAWHHKSRVPTEEIRRLIHGMEEQS